MKKLLALVLALSFVFCLAACGDDKKDKDKDDDDKTAKAGSVQSDSDIEDKDNLLDDDVAVEVDPGSKTELSGATSNITPSTSVDAQWQAYLTEFEATLKAFIDASLALNANPNDAALKTKADEWNKKGEALAEEIEAFASQYESDAEKYAQFQQDMTDIYTKYASQIAQIDD